MSLQYHFGDRLAMSQGVSTSGRIADILTATIPGAVRADKANEADDRQGTDWWVTLESSQRLSVDCKVRERDFLIERGKDDLALETWSVVEKGLPGWTRDAKKRTDYVLWLWSSTGRWCLMPFRLLCGVFTENWQQWAKVYGVSRQFTPRANGGYHSECIFVPRREVWAAVYRRYGGCELPNRPAAL